MTDIDLTAAVEAAAVAMVPFVMQQEWSDVSAEAQREAISVAHLAITAAAPLIEAAVREQVAREIEAERDRLYPYDGSAIRAYVVLCAQCDDDARIARGGAR